MPHHFHMECILVNKEPVLEKLGCEILRHSCNVSDLGVFSKDRESSGNNG